MSDRDVYLATLKELFFLIKAVETGDSSGDTIERLKEVYNSLYWYVR